jgi:azurin
VEYQLGRLTNDELVRVERRDDDVKYRLVYYALLTRKGLARSVRDEAVAALTKIDKVSATEVLLDAAGRVRADDTQTAGTLLGMLLGQPADVLRAQRDALSRATSDTAHPFVVQGGYGGMVIADGSPAAAWQAAATQGQLTALLRSVPYIANADLRTQLFQPVAALIADSRDAAVRADAIAAIGWTRRDAATFELLAREILQGPDADARAAAIRSLPLIPETAWSAPSLEPLARGLVAVVKDTAPDKRTEPDAIDAIQIGERLASKLPDASRRAVLRDLRALGVRVVRIDTVPEQLMFDLKWFVVEAGKPVQVVLHNLDAMPHNLVTGKPGSVQEIGMAGASMPPPAEPDAKAYVPDSPLVLQSTRLLNAGETERLSFTAPKEPGEYVYLCTFPGHWVRMYGVMLVVPDLEAWEAKPINPADPITKKPYGPPR